MRNYFKHRFVLGSGDQMQYRTRIETIIYTHIRQRAGHHTRHNHRRIATHMEPILGTVVRHPPLRRRHRHRRRRHLCRMHVIPMVLLLLLRRLRHQLRGRRRRARLQSNIPRRRPVPPCREDRNRTQSPERIVRLVGREVRPNQGQAELGGGRNRQIDAAQVVVERGHALRIDALLQHLRLANGPQVALVQQLGQRQLVLQLAAHALQPLRLVVARQRLLDVRQLGSTDVRRVAAIAGRRRRSGAAQHAGHAVAAVDVLVVVAALVHLAAGRQTLGGVIVGQRLVVFGLERHEAGPAFGHERLDVVAADRRMDEQVFGLQLGRLAGEVLVDLRLSNMMRRSEIGNHILRVTYISHSQ